MRVMENLMPRFYFHLASKDSHIQDDSGKELATLNDAYEHARKLIHKILFHVRSCRNIGACLRATGSAKRTQANKDRCSKRRPDRHRRQRENAGLLRLNKALRSGRGG